MRKNIFWQQKGHQIFQYGEKINRENIHQTSLELVKILMIPEKNDLEPINTLSLFLVVLLFSVQTQVVH